MPRLRWLFLPSLLSTATFGVPAVLAGEFTNFVGMKFRDIPPGSFFMGCCPPPEGSRPYAKGDPRCPSGTDNDFDNYAAVNSSSFPQHRVTISRPFQMGVHEVTYGHYWKFVTATQPNRQGRRPTAEQLLLPVGNISWEGAQTFIAWLNTTKPASDTGTYRLPSEAEWEYAARAGTDTRYSWGKTMKKGMANCNDPSACGPAWSEKLAPVGSFPPNRWGLHDMESNAYEWVQDCWHDSYRGAPADGSAWESSNCEERVMRSSSPFNDPYFLRLASRAKGLLGKEGRNNFLGFRVVRVPGSGR